MTKTKAPPKHKIKGDSSNPKTRRFVSDLKKAYNDEDFKAFKKLVLKADEKTINEYLLYTIKKFSG
jgi:hypothetical protein